MIDYKKQIKVIGFDLDHTLYRGSKETNRVIQEYIFAKIAVHLKVGAEEAGKMFGELYQDGKGLSGRKTLIELGIPNAGEIIQEALERADIASTLSEDPGLLALLKRLKERYLYLDIVTGSSLKQTLQKLAALGVPESMFSNCITDEVAVKSDGDAYRHWLGLYDYPAESFLYVGDRPDTDGRIPAALGIQIILVNVKEKDPSLPFPQLPSLEELEKYL